LRQQWEGEADPDKQSEVQYVKVLLLFMLELNEVTRALARERVTIVDYSAAGASQFATRDAISALSYLRPSYEGRPGGGPGEQAAW
jgi:hypothetical protein